MSIEERQIELERDYLNRTECGHINDLTRIIGLSSEALKGIIELRDKYKNLSNSNKWHHPGDTMLWNDVYIDLDKLVNRIEGYEKI